MYNDGKTFCIENVTVHKKKKVIGSANNDVDDVAFEGRGCYLRDRVKERTSKDTKAKCVTVG